MSWRLWLTGVLVLCACTGSPEGESQRPKSGFAPVLEPAPGSISSALVVDSSVAVAFKTEKPAVGAKVDGCAGALRDPRTGVRYRLHESRREETTVDRPGRDTVKSLEVQANYLPTAATADSLPTGRYLRIVCGSNRVLGLAAALSATP